MASKNKSTSSSRTANEDRKKTSNVDVNMDAILAEYNSLRSEIQYRSEFQNRLLEIHVSTLIVILGAGVSQTLGPWILMLIPIESSIFGLWYLDHALIIGEIGAYIRKYVETRVSDLLDKPRVMFWEAGYRVGLVTPPKKRVITFRRLLLITFAGPSLIILTIYLFILIITIPQVNVAFQTATGHQTQFAYTDSQWWLVYIVWVVGFLLLSAFLSTANHRSKVSDARTAEANQALKSQIASNKS